MKILDTQIAELIKSGWVLSYDKNCSAYIASSDSLSSTCMHESFAYCIINAKRIENRSIEAKKADRKQEAKLHAIVAINESIADLQMQVSYLKDNNNPSNVAYNTISTKIEWLADKINLLEQYLEDNK